MEHTWKLVAVIVYFAMMVGIGLWAYRKTSDGEDYIVGGRSLHPFTAALSAGASDMSGWLMMGLPGALYLGGLFQGWMAIGLTIGAGLNWLLVAPRLRHFTESASNSITLPSFFENRLFDRTRALRIASGIVILVFFTFYVSSMMVAGGVFFQSSFGGTYLAGMLLVGAITIGYTMIGGFLGATYTDVVQGVIMLAALIVVPALAISAAGGPGEVWSTVATVDPNWGSLTAGGTLIGGISAAAWGLGYFGQPHIVARFMALRSSRDAAYGAAVGVGWMALSVLGVVVTAAAGLALFTQNGTEPTDPNAESLILDLSQILMHPLIAGFVLAAVLAAIMSTMSSQLVVSGSALVEDLLGATGKTYSAKTQLWLSRGAVLTVAIIAVLLALRENSTILALVGFAWAGFGSAFGPIVILSLFWRRINNWGALAGMIGGATTAFLWGMVGDGTFFGLFPERLYEIVPGFVVGLILAVVVSLITPKPSQEQLDEYDRAVHGLRSGIDAGAYPDRELREKSAAAAAQGSDRT